MAEESKIVYFLSRFFPATIWSYFSGFLLTAAWFLLIDAQVDHNRNNGRGMDFLAWISVFFSLPGFFILNLTFKEWVNPRNVVDPHDPAWRRRAIFAILQVLLGTILLFIGVVIGVVMMAVMIQDDNKTYVYGQVMTVMHPIMTVLAAFTMFFGRVFLDARNISRWFTKKEDMGL